MMHGNAASAAAADDSDVPRIRHLDQLLRERADLRPDAETILSPGLRALTYRGLRAQADRTAHALRAAGVGRADRVAIALPHGPSAAAAFVAVACAATAAPLDPAGQAREFDYFFAAMDAKAVIVERGNGTKAAAVARAQGRTVLELAPLPDAPAGEFELAVGEQSPPGGRSAVDQTADPADTAFLMHTSGTTGRPKLVPQSHRVVCTSARNIAASLGLGEADRCLNVLPLFHGHGLMSPLLATLWAGASVACPPGFDAAAFPGWLEEFAPTWYTAVPAIHQAILGAVAARPGALRRPLRFVRSASAPLADELRSALECMLGAPVIDSYGMTEACSIITSNPLPPAVRKPGSVGVSIGNELAVLGEDGAPLPAGQVGEIALRGGTVVAGYDGNLGADAGAFAGGWFRTGDLGYLDQDGFLYLTGRAKEVINRGGTKVSPAEVDEALLAHLAIADAAAFPLPHATLGEEVAAAIVLREGSVVEDDELHAFLADRLAEPKVPRRVFRVAAIPRTSTGKVQRAQLAGQLTAARGSGGARPDAPGTPLEAAVARVWSEVLCVERVGRREHFFDLGGNSLLVRQVQVRLQELVGREIPVVELFAHPTVEALGEYLAREQDDLMAPHHAEDLAQGGRRLAQQLELRRRQTDVEL